MALYQELISMGMLIIVQNLVLVSKTAQFKSYAAGLFPFSFCFSLFVIGLILFGPSYGTVLSILCRSFPYSASLLLSHVPNSCYGAIGKVTPLAGPGLSHPWKWYLKVELSGLGVSEFCRKVSFMGSLSFGG